MPLTFGKEITPMANLFRIGLAFSLVLCSSCEKRGESSEVDVGRENEVSIEGLTKLSGEVTFTLEDGEKLNREYPDTFEIPERNLRNGLQKGDLVKLMFSLTDSTNSQTERMWVIVSGGDARGYIGVLDNDPYCTDEIKSGLEVKFRPENVISIFEEEVTPAQNEPAEQDA